MMRILVAVDGTERGKRALAWAARYGHREQAALMLVSVVNPAEVSALGADPKAVEASVEHLLATACKWVVEKYPDLELSAKVVYDKIVDGIVGAVKEYKADMVVMGSHHGASVGETVGGAKGLRVSVLVDVPTVVVPCDWDMDNTDSNVVVGIGPDDSCTNAVEFAVHEALADNVPLELVSAWGLPPLLSRPAEALGGGWGPVGDQFQQKLDALSSELKEGHPGLEVTGYSVEGSSPTRVILDYTKNKGCKLLVLGTHSRSTFGRAVFGSVTHSVLLNLCVPTVVVPQE